MTTPCMVLISGGSVEPASPKKKDEDYQFKPAPYKSAWLWQIPEWFNAFQHKETTP